MSEQTTGAMTGAQSLITSLEAAGVEHIFGIPGGAILPAYDPLFDSQDPAHPGAPRAGRRPRGPGLRRGDRPGRCLHGHLRPGRDQPGDADRRRPHGLGADGRHHRPGRRRRDRHRRLPGGRHPRHHDADHQAQLPGHRPRGDPADGSPRRSTSPPPAGPARCSSTSPSRRCRRRRRSTWPTELHLPGYRPVDPAARQADPRGDPADAGGAPAGALRRRRRDPRRAPRAELRDARRAHRHPGRHHADGPRRVPRQPPAAPRHARHARHRRRGRGAAEERPDHQPRRPLRRPGHRQPRLVRTRRPGHPRRHRPGRDRQEPARRRPDRRRRPRGHRRPGRGAAGRGRRRPRRRLRGAGSRSWPASRGKYPLGYDTPDDGARAAVRHRAARRDRRAGHDLHRGRRPAPDVGRALRRLREARAPGSTPAASGPWASRSRRRWAPRSACPTRRCGRSTATAASR